MSADAAATATLQSVMVNSTQETHFEDDSDDDDDELLKPQLRIIKSTQDSVQKLKQPKTPSDNVEVTSTPPDETNSTASTKIAMSPEQLEEKARRDAKFVVSFKLDYKVITSPSMLKWLREKDTRSGKTMFIPCYVVPNVKEAMAGLNVKLTATNNTLVRFLGIEYAHADKLQAVPYKSLSNYDDDSLATGKSKGRQSTLEIGDDDTTTAAVTTTTTETKLSHLWAPTKMQHFVKLVKSQTKLAKAVDRDLKLRTEELTLQLVLEAAVQAKVDRAEAAIAAAAAEAASSKLNGDDTNDLDDDDDDDDDDDMKDEEDYVEHDDAIDNHDDATTSPQAIRFAETNPNAEDVDDAAAAAAPEAAVHEATQRTRAAMQSTGGSYYGSGGSSNGGAKPKLRAGDVIQYYPPQMVAHGDNLTSATVLACLTGKRHNGVVLHLSDGQFLPRDHQVRILQRYLNGKRVDLPPTSPFFSLRNCVLDGSLNYKITDVTTLSDRLSGLYANIREEIAVTHVTGPSGAGSRSCSSSSRVIGDASGSPLADTAAVEPAPAVAAVTADDVPVSSQESTAQSKILTAADRKPSASQKRPRGPTESKENHRGENDPSLTKSKHGLGTQPRKRRKTEKSATAAASASSTTNDWKPMLDRLLAECSADRRRHRANQAVIDIRESALKVAVAVRQRMDGAANEDMRNIWLAQWQNTMDCSRERVWDFLNGNRSNLLHSKVVKDMSAKFQAWLEDSALVHADTAVEIVTAAEVEGASPTTEENIPFARSSSLEHAVPGESLEEAPPVAPVEGIDPDPQAVQVGERPSSPCQDNL